MVQFGPVVRQDGAAFYRFTVSGVDGLITETYGALTMCRPFNSRWQWLGLTSTGLLKADSTASWGTLTVNPVVGCRLLSEVLKPYEFA